MKLSALVLKNHEGGSNLQLGNICAGLNVVYDPSDTATPAADLIANLLYNHEWTPGLASLGRSNIGGQVDVENQGRLYRLQRSQDGQSRGQVAVSSLDDRTVDRDEAERLFSNLSPTAARLGAIDFREPLPIEWLLSEEVAQELEAAEGHSNRRQRTCSNSSRDSVSLNSRRHDELIERRDAVVKELESRIATERRQSRELDGQWRELDARYQKQHREVTALREQLQAVQSELAELEARLRYFRLDTVEDLPSRSDYWKAQLADLELQIGHQESVNGQLETRQAEVRRRLADLKLPEDQTDDWMVAAERAWLAVSRRIATDLEGEVARLARSDESHTCVCLDAHPRLRPIAEAFHSQLDTFKSLLEGRERVILANDLRAEAEHLEASRETLQKTLECLLERRQVIQRRYEMSRRLDSDRTSGFYRAYQGKITSLDLPVGDVEQLERRREELARELPSLRDRLATAEPKFDAVRKERDTLSRRRTELLSIRPIEEVQQELSAIQRALTHELRQRPTEDLSCGVSRASELLAQLTDGRLLGLRSAKGGRGLRVVDPAGKAVAIESLSQTERDQVGLSICLALADSYGERGIRRPVVLDEPFLRMERRDTAALAAVLEDFGRRGNQAVVFSAKRKAIKRFDVAVQDLQGSRSDQTTVPDQRFTSDAASVEASSRVAAEDTGDDVFHLHEGSRLWDALELRSETGNELARLGLQTVGHLWDADPEDVAGRLNRDDISRDTVRSWQIQTTLLCFVPDLTLEDARVLEGAGVYCPDELAEMDGDGLFRAIEQYLATAGRRYPYRGDRYSRSRAGRWIRGAGRNRNRWRRNARWQRTQRRRGLRRPRSRFSYGNSENGNARNRSRRHDRPGHDHTPDLRRESTTDRDRSRPPRFYLSAHDAVVDAPSIGEKTAERLQKVGVRSVADLLNADPADVSKRLDVRRISRDTVQTWQRQARLLCQIPEIRGHDVQILIGCDLTDPNIIARMHPEELLSRVSPFCNSKAGERIIRSGKKPDLAEVTDWITWAGQQRSLDAA